MPNSNEPSDNDRVDVDEEIAADQKDTKERSIFDQLQQEILELKKNSHDDAAVAFNTFSLNNLNPQEGRDISAASFHDEEEFTPRVNTKKEMLIAIVLFALFASGVLFLILYKFIFKPDCIPSRRDSRCTLKNNKKECRWDDGWCDWFNEKYPDCDVETGIIYEWKFGLGECNQTFNTEECGWHGGACVAQNEFFKKYPNCEIPISDIEELGNGYCTTMTLQKENLYNIEACGFDGGDCIGFNEKYPKCKVQYTEFLGDGHCDKYYMYFNEDCGWDGGDCDGMGLEEYPLCIVDKPWDIGNGVCTRKEYNNELCGWDGGDCLWLHENFPNCDIEILEGIGDGKCDIYGNIEQCGFDGGDCVEFNTRYPNCSVSYPLWIGDGICNHEYHNYNTYVCGWDGGDCYAWNKFNKLYPNCLDSSEGIIDWHRIGDGKCDGFGHPWYQKECGWDGGDCEGQGPQEYPNCIVPDPDEIGNGSCRNHIFYNNEICGWDGGDCVWFNEYLPNCTTQNAYLLGDGRCESRYGTGYNTEECRWEGGDCIEFNKKYPNCKFRNSNSLYHLGDGICDEYWFNTEECGWDDGDCLVDGYPDCHVQRPYQVGDDFCQNDSNIEECGWDGGDCLQFNEFKKMYPDCQVDRPYYIGDGICQHWDNYNTEECGWDGGDCIEFNEKYPHCESYSKLGDGVCDYESGWRLNTEECGWDDGDCVVEGYPDCHVDMPEQIGNNICNNWGGYNTEECGWDGGDCIEFNEKYPNCQRTPNLIGDGICYDWLNIEECGFDGGDCIELNQKYPNCNGIDYELGNGECDFKFNKEDCGWDAGDCYMEEYPDCHTFPNAIGNGYCSKEYNTTECGFDGGDCILEGYPNCVVESDYHFELIGDGTCNHETNSEECGWDGGDCIELNEKYPNCAANPQLINSIGNGDCTSHDWYLPYNLNTEECGWDGGDCLIEGYPDCHVNQPELIGDGKCHYWKKEYNSLECGWDGGDCVVDGYPDCRVNVPEWIGDGECQTNSWTFKEYNTSECGYDGGDCLV